MENQLLTLPPVAIAILFTGMAFAQAPNVNPLLAPRETLRLTKTLLVEKSETPKFTRELVRLYYRKGDPVMLYICKPKGVKNPPVALVLYSFPQEAATRFLKDDFCNWITEKGIAFIGFEGSYTGERYKSGPMKEWFISELPKSMSRTVHDIQIIGDYARGRGDLDTNRMGIFGQGSGGTAAILASSVDARFKVVDVMNPWGDWLNWTKKASEIRTPEDRKRFTSNAFLKTIAPYDPLPGLTKVKAKDVRMQFIRKTANVVDSAADRMLKAAPSNVVKKSFPDPMSSYKEMTDGRVFSWIAAKLKCL